MKSEKPSKAKKDHMLVLNRARKSLVAFKPVKDDHGKTFFDGSVRIEPGFNRIAIDDWSVASHTDMVKHAVENDDLRELESTDDIHPDIVDQVLKNCASIDSVKWWHKVDRRPKVRDKIGAWIKDMEAAFARKRDGRRQIQVT
jgi:hypothetical protein